MKLSEEQMKAIVALRDNLIEQIDRHHDALESLEKNIVILDGLLKESSFKKASEIGKEASKLEENISDSKTSNDSIPIKQGKDGKIIANAFVTPEQLEIVLDETIGITIDTPPFKSFFLDRIIGEMKRKDVQDVESGKIQKESIIDYIINQNGPNIREIIIKNYRQKERINELINTAGWSLTRMLENVSK
ncbi:MAG: hypothetical protein ACW9WZ_05270 [Nitrosopumilus sp.]